MTAETISPPVTPPADASPATGPSMRERIDQYYEQLKIFSMPKSLLMRPGSKNNFYEDYQSKFSTQVRTALLVFESNKTIPADIKEQIRDIVHVSIGKIKAYDAMDAAPLAGFLGVSAHLLAILVSVFSGLVWHPHLRAFLEWIGYYLVILLLLSLFIGALYWTLTKRLTQRTFITILLFSLFAPSFLFFWGNQYVWPASLLWLGDAITVGALSGVIAGLGSVVGFSSVFVWNSYQALQKLKKHPQEEFLCKSLDLLMHLGDPDQLPSREFAYLSNPSFLISSNLHYPAIVVRDLDRLSLSLERLLKRDLKHYDAYTQAWLEQSAQQMANDILRLKQSILLPVEGVRLQVIEAVAHKLVLVAQGNWGNLEKCELPPMQTHRVRLIAWLRGGLSFLIPVALILTLQFYPFLINEALKNSLTTLAVGWAIVALLNWIDPSAINQIKEGADLAGFWKKSD